MSDSKRLEKLQQSMQKHNLDAVALIPGSNFRYLTGSVHYVMERPFVLFVNRNGESAIAIPGLEVDLFSGHGFQTQIFPWKDADGYDGAFAAASEALGLAGKRIGVEGQLMRFFESQIIQRHAPGATVIDAHEPISWIRLHKDDGEIAALRKAIQISEQALEDTVQQVKVGMTERDVLNILTAKLTEHGGEGTSFDPIVLAGANSAKPHGKVRSDYKIQSGDALLFDFGTRHKGYPADITRTFFVGEVSDEHRKIYAAVQKANEVGRNTAGPGVACGAVDDKTTQSLKDSGYTEYILHRTGHGLGLDVHEAPYITSGITDPLEPGMVFTVEPGLYLAGDVGIRVEDNVVITNDGCESLTTFPRDLRVIG